MDINKAFKEFKNNDIGNLYSTLSESWFDYKADEEPNMADGIGSIMDKLATVDFKMAHNQNILYEVRKQTPEEFEKQWSNNMAGLHDVLKRCLDLNSQRSRLVDEIDRKLAAMIKGELNPNDFVNPQHKTY